MGDDDRIYLCTCVYLCVPICIYIHTDGFSVLAIDTWRVLEFLLVFLLGWGGSLHRLEAAERRIRTNARWAWWLTLGRVICYPLWRSCVPQSSVLKAPASILPPWRSIPPLALSGISFIINQLAVQRDGYTSCILPLKVRRRWKMGDDCKVNCGQRDERGCCRGLSSVAAVDELSHEKHNKNKTEGFSGGQIRSLFPSTSI